MTKEELETIEARLSKITPGKWTATDFDVHTDTPTGVWNTTQICPVTPAMGKNEECYQRINAEFIANAPGDERALIAEVRRLRAELDKTVLDGLNVQALVARVEELEVEAAKSRRVFVWEFPWKDSNNVLRICWSKSLRFYLTMSDSCLELIDALTGDPFDCYDIHGVDKIGLAEQLIRELGFAREGDVFDRSKVTP